MTGPGAAADAGGGLHQAVAALRADPARTALLFDFDGTLSPTVADPAAAEAAPDAVALLTELAGAYATVAIVSGRPVAFLADRLPPALVLSGQYGLELVVAGLVVDRPELDPWRRAAAAAAERAAADAPAGLLVEPKGLGVSLHYRTRPDLAAAAGALAATLATELGLVAHPAKMSVELRPPIDTSKGTAVRELAGEATAVLYAGDDLGDLPAFVALDALRATGVTTLAVAVGGPELPPAVRDAADLVLAGPPAMVELLRALRP